MGSLLQPAGANIGTALGEWCFPGQNGCRLFTFSVGFLGENLGSGKSIREFYQTVGRVLPIKIWSRNAQHYPQHGHNAQELTRRSKEIDRICSSISNPSTRWWWIPWNHKNSSGNLLQSSADHWLGSGAAGTMQEIPPYIWGTSGWSSWAAGESMGGWWLLLVEWFGFIDCLVAMDGFCPTNRKVKRTIYDFVLNKQRLKRLKTTGTRLIMLHGYYRYLTP